MTNAHPREAKLRADLIAQGLRVEDKADGSGFIVYAEEGADTPLNPSGMTHVHSSAFRGERSTMMAVEGELRKLGYNPSWRPPEKTAASMPDLGEVYEKKPEPNPDDPDDRWVTYEEAASIVGLKGASGVYQRVKVGKLRAVKIPTEVSAFGGTRSVLQYHVNVKELLASGKKNGRATQPVRVSYQDNPVGHVKEASAAAKRAMGKIRSALDELEAAHEIIMKESDGALEELADYKRRMHSIEDHLGKAVAKL